MPTSPTPTDSHSFNFSTFLHDLLHGFGSLMSSSPVTAGLAGAGIALALLGFIRSVIHSGHQRDPIRRFTRSDKAIILTRAGNRCEYHGPFGRCGQTERLEADHVHPWSRGGQTALSNGQALCSRHNRDKRAAIPYGWQLRRMERRRAAYFPADHSGAVIRHARANPRRGR